MRSIDDQLLEIELRSSLLKEARTRRRAAVSSVIAATACIALISVMSVALSGMDMTVSAVSGDAPFGSLILMNYALPYMIIGMLAFLLGIAFTLLCIHVRERKRGTK